MHHQPVLFVVLTQTPLSDLSAPIPNLHPYRFVLQPHAVRNQHHDEAFDVTESVDDSLMTPEVSPKNVARQAAPVDLGDTPPQHSDYEDETEDLSHMEPQLESEMHASGGPSYLGTGVTEDEDVTASYDPTEFTATDVSNDMLELFAYIDRYQPTETNPIAKLSPFIPDYIPAVGDIDAFIKVPRPDGKPDELGLTVLDEPAAQQSDPTVLDLQLRVVSKQTNLQPMTVRSIDQADKNPQKITTWINNIQDVHRKKPPPTVHYSREMPDIEGLMQVWPHEFEEALKKMSLPSAEMDLTTEQYARVMCAILDVPVHEKVVESLHVVFTLYSEFKQNQHFQEM